MSKEMAYIVMFCGGALLFAIGGTLWKPARRFILPILMGIVALLSGVFVLNVIGAVILSMVAFSMPYGSNTAIPIRAITAFAMGLCLLPLKLSFIVIIVPVVFQLGMWLSWRFNWLTWKWVELFTGAIWGLTAVALF